MNIEVDTADDSFASDLLRGAPEISKFIDEPVPRVYYLAGKQILPIGRLGSVLIASKRRLREHYERLTQGVEPQPQSRLIRHRSARPPPRRGRPALPEASRPAPGGSVVNRLGPGALAGAAGAGDRASGDAQLDTIFAPLRQAAAAPRPRTTIVICRISRSAPQRLWAADDGREARCVSCPAHLSQIPPAVAVVEAPAAGIGLVAGICASRIARDDRDLIAAAYAALQALAPSLRTLGPGGSA